MVDARDDRAKRNIATALCNQLITTAAGIVTLRVLLASFGSEAYGICASITQFLSYIMLLESGIGGVARAKLYAPLARRNMCEVSAVYNAIRRFFYYVAAAFVVYSVLLGLTYHDLAGVTLYSRPYIFALVLTIGLSTLAKYMGGLANLTLIVADQRQYVNNCIMIATAVVNAAAVVLLTQLKTQLLWVKLGSSLIFAVRPLLYRFYVRKHYPLPKAGKASAVLDQKWTGIGQHIAYFLHMNTDIVLFTLFADVKLVAVYAVYNMVIGSVRAITESFSSGMEAKFGELIAKGRLDRLRRAFWRYQTLIVSVSVVLFSCTAALIVPFVRLYTKGITDADYIQPVFALILLMAEAVNCMMLPCSGLPARGKPFSANALGCLWGSGDQYHSFLRFDPLESADRRCAGYLDRNGVSQRLLHGLFRQTHPVHSAFKAAGTVRGSCRAAGCARCSRLSAAARHCDRQLFSMGFVGTCDLVSGWRADRILLLEALEGSKI